MKTLMVKSTGTENVLVKGEREKHTVVEFSSASVTQREKCI